MRVFISYRHNSEPDVAVANAVLGALNDEHEVFIDTKIGLGVDWSQRIENEIERAEFLICLLSAESVASEMVGGEISMAHERAKKGDGRPVILPVRLAFDDPFPYHLRAYLDRIQWFNWQESSDTPRLIDELRRAMSGDTSGEATRLTAGPAPSRDGFPVPAFKAEPVPLDYPEGTIDPDSALYIERTSDAIALRAIRRQGVTITIKGPYQMGKSSLLMRTIDAAARAEKRVVFVDFKLFDSSARASADVFLRGFCSYITDELGLENRIDDHWDEHLGPSLRCRRYFSRYLLPSLDRPLLIAMDEVQEVLQADFRTDFFGMLRSWHNDRARDPLWRKLDVTLVTSTEPYQFIENPSLSPFNVGEVIQLTDFSLPDVQQLCARHGSPLDDAQETQLYSLLNGHPYLTRRALYFVATSQMSPTDLFEHAAQPDGPFGDHLRYILIQLNARQDLMQALGQVLRSGTYEREEVFHQLYGAGLVRRQDGKVLARCQLYADYLGRHIDG